MASRAASTGMGRQSKSLQASCRCIARAGRTVERIRHTFLQLEFRQCAQDVSVQNAGGNVLIYRGMYGVGDCIHQRAILREVMQEGPVVLETFYRAMYHDLVDQGLVLRRLAGMLPRVRERNTFRSDILLPRK